MDEKEMMEALRAPFPAEDIRWRAGSVTKDGSKAMALAYIDARAVMGRLDEVFGVLGWQDQYTAWGPESITAGIGINTGDIMNARGEEEWIWKWDGASKTNFEATKGGISDAFKRAAVKWGIGRYLYNLDTQWVAAEKRGKSTILTVTPKLPAWALPGGSPAQKKNGTGRRAIEKDLARTERALEKEGGGPRGEIAKAQTEPGPQQKRGLDPGALAESVVNDTKQAGLAFCRRIVERYGYYESVRQVKTVAAELGLNYTVEGEPGMEHKLLEYAEYPGDGG